MKNSDTLLEIFTALYKISSRKTSEGHTVTLMDSIIDELEKKHYFMTYVKVKDTRFIEDEDFLNINNKIEKIEPKILCNALFDCIITMNESLSKNAGPFFYKEISNKISDKCNSLLKINGIDLGLMQLEYEVKQLEKRIIKTIKDKK
jgi:hypothetical protein